MLDNKIQVEYLIAIDAKKSFCSDENSFIHFLKAYNDFSVDEKKAQIIYESIILDYNLKLQKQEVPSQHIFFQINIIYKYNDEFKLELFEKFLRTLKMTLITISNIQVLWDDVSFYYAQKGYPLIHKTENLMRKLITKFMIINVDLSWAESSLPVNVKDSVKSKTNKDVTPDFLYKVDFIQLKNFLFSEYSTLRVEDLYKKLGKIDKLDDLSLDELKKYVPTSNWERYFSSIVDTDDNYISKKWESLYGLRNKIAHNNSINRVEFDQIMKLTKEIDNALLQAIDKLDEVMLSESDKNHIAYNFNSKPMSDPEPNIVSLINRINELNSIIASTIPYLNKIYGAVHSKFLQSKNILDELVSMGLLDRDSIERIKSIQMLEKTLVLNQETISYTYLTSKLTETNFLIHIFKDKIIPDLSYRSSN